MYENLGFVKGTLRFAPRKVADGVVVLTLRVRGFVTDKDNGERKRVWFFPSFTVFGREAYKALTNLEEGQRVELEYHLETQTKMVKGEKKFFEDKVAVKITYGEKRQPGEARPAEERSRPAANRRPAAARSAALQAETIVNQEEQQAPEEDGRSTGEPDVPYTEVTEDTSRPQRRSAFGQLKK